MAERTRPLADDATRTTPSFTLVEFNPRRHIRGAEAARVNVDYGRGDADLLWMSAADIRQNMVLHGKHPELIKAMECYSHPFHHYPPAAKPMLTHLEAEVGNG